jgi:hypothetical protein
VIGWLSAGMGSLNAQRLAFLVLLPRAANDGRYA